MWKILIFEISAQNGLRDVILGSEVKTSDLAAHFSRNSVAANTVLFTIQTFNEHSRMAKINPRPTGGGGGYFEPPLSFSCDIF